MKNFTQWLAEKELELASLTSSDEYFSYRKNYESEMKILQAEENDAWEKEQEILKLEREQTKEDDIRNDIYGEKSDYEDNARNEF